MKYISYSGTPYQKMVNIPEKKKFGKKYYELIDVFPNYGGMNGHNTALNVAKQQRELGFSTRVDAHSGYSAVYQW